ncbi:hypothetical protein VTK73DRAFT_955 [Phialemonium thermophilum]|uniref:Uncharacterized protein n=1 Tax=Phialemonium thermophilum TaxID=223376 RepID=A0ABR3XCM9_9PEZI
MPAGRGGAGNFSGTRPAAEADLREQSDVVAAKVGQAKPRTGLTGRGGVGNWTDSTSAVRGNEDRDLEAGNAPEDIDPPPQRAHEHTPAAAVTGSANVRSALSPKSIGVTGRGGIGNWSERAERLAVAQATEERKRKEELDKTVLQDVEAGLPMPPAAYHHLGRDIANEDEQD